MVTTPSERAVEFAKRYLAQRDQLRAELKTAESNGETIRAQEIKRDLAACERYIVQNKLDRFSS